MLEALPGALPAGSRWTRPAGGMFVWVELSLEADALALLPTAVEEGVAFVPGAPFFAEEGRRNSLRLSFVTLSPNQISEALRRLRAALTPDESRV